MDYRNFMRYLRIEKRVSAHTLAAYTLDLDQVNEYLSAEWGLGDPEFPKTLHLRSWLISLMEKGLQARSINRKISTLKTYFKFMIREGLHPGPDPCRALQRPKTPKNLPRSVSIGSMERLLGEGLPEDFIELRDRCVVELLYGCGLRRAELIQLQWQDWDRSNAQIKVTGKRSKVRILPLTGELIEILSHYCSAWEQCGSLNKSQSLFVTKKGETLYPKLVGDIVRKALSRVSTQDQRSPHVLRHSFATHLLDNGADLNAVKTLLGHANLAATQIYTHQSIEKLKEIHRKTHPKG